jgi:DNA-binding phage protein
MPLTKSFRDTVQARAAVDPAFRAGLYQEAVQSMLDGDLATGRSLLRDFVNATVGFAALAQRLGTSDKSLMRMLGPDGNPQMANMVAILQAVKDDCGLVLTVSATPIRRVARRLPSTSPGRRTMERVLDRLEAAASR